MTEFIASVKENLNILNKNLSDIDDNLVDLSVMLTIERLKLYLNCDKVPERLLLITAEISNSVLKKLVKSASNDIDVAVSSVSDNGQSISYSNALTNYFNTASDNELFGGFTSILSRYRKIKVV